MKEKNISTLLIGVSLFGLFILGFPYFVFADITTCEPTSRIALCRDNPGKTGDQICQERGTSCDFFCAEYYSGAACTSNYVTNCSQTCSDEYWACCKSGGAPPSPPTGCNEGETKTETKTESWTGYKCQGAGCGAKIISADCETTYKRTLVCRNGKWEPSSDWQCQTTTCQEKGVYQNCLAWQVCAINNANLKCDDNDCWMEKSEWKTIVDGNCEKSFSCGKGNFGACQPTDFQKESLSCQCWGKCLDPIIDAHYYDGVKELPWAEDCGDENKFPEKWQREECEMLNADISKGGGIKLPVKFGWEMGNALSYWVSSTDQAPQSLKVKVDNLERLLTNDELLNITKFTNEDREKGTKKERLEKLLAEAPPDRNNSKFKELFDLLKQLTQDSSLTEEKLEKALKEKKAGDDQRLKQILYFIYFVEGDDPVGKPGGGAGTFTYSFSEDKQKGPCSLASGQNYNLKVKLCCGKDPENCGPPDPIRDEKMTADQKKKWDFKTNSSPEPTSILEVKIKKWTKPEEIEEVDPKTGKKFVVWESKEFLASSTRWIDTDWNGPGYLNLKDGDYVDFEWCSTGSPVYSLRAFYDDKLELFEPKEEKEAREEEKIESLETGAPDCDDPSLPCFCEKSEDPAENKIKACLCANFPPPPGFDFEKDCKTLLLESEICHPALWSGSILRLKWDVKEFFNKDIEEIRKMINEGKEMEIKWEIQKLMEKNCTGLLDQASAKLKLAKEEKIEVEEDPYFPLLYGNEVIRPKDFSPNNLGGPWKWDFQLLYFSLYKVFNWQMSTTLPGVGEESKLPNYGQKWNFVLSKKPVMEWDTKLQKMVPIEEIKELLFVPEETEKSTTTIDSLIVPVANRLQHFVFEKVRRIFSYKVKIFDEAKKIISIPEKFSLIIRASRMVPGVELWRELTLHQLWPCLKKQTRDKKIDESDPNYYRLDREFTAQIIPCWDERGEICEPDLGLSQKFKTTGAKPTFAEEGSGPPPPEKAKIPRYLNWDGMPGAASYFYQVEGPTSLKGVMPITSRVWADLKGDGIYTWKVKTCADKCTDEKMLQCGTSSDEMIFYGCELNPPKNYSPKSAEQFYPGELSNLSWDAVDCQGPVPFYQYKLEYGAPIDCRVFKRALRDECKKIQESDECKKLLENKEIIPATTINTNSVSLPPLRCLGVYNWSIRACLDEDCEEAGDWSGAWYFYIVLEKIAGGIPTGGGGFGTCRDLVPCSWGSCTFKHIPMLIANIINCILWTLTPIALVGLVVYTGITFYFAFGAPDTIERVKSIWKAGGKGFLIMFFAWTFLNLIFRFLGWRKEIFGDWFNPL